ncbi:hypothetical protein CEUSTIGMA_g6616.t1 [Chlamydomonas eustigma]|uniref:Protein kinase domain-containing protein n=1 Tax=Chlamydomonas eustigma TaxID=1157962 RepID=A0A250X7Z3_9CHLO|nr:hypothetical protein CEUSTIGMA_g6616.t1 [Chlamydomonas eustigma]|eukprot:GAX79176.1 hypothetical protein CEUSTIGMA_g6616.t1 [Chlamydomonas eustigma]
MSNQVCKGYKYALQSPLNSSNPNQYTTIASSGGINMNNAVFVNVYIPEQVGQNWQLWVEPVAGWYPSWTAPLIAAVIILSAVISGLLFVAMLYHVRQGSLLRETTAANQELARTTAILEEEKIRMDALLARQYDLLSCLDSKHPSVITAKKVLTLEHIDEVRRLVNDASRHGNMEAKDPIEVQELLGEGAFGKVYKGLWRGTEVAIKTIVLPSNMAGSEKREKMAVMEAAISSSLVHPNIVTTYTYSIRPHLDSMSTHASLMEGFGDLIECTPLDSAIGKGGQGSVATHVSSLDSSMQTSIHSYEVRLVIEFCDKGSLHEALSMGAFLQGCGLCVSAILETAADVARAIVHMHAADVIHSDLKARNIMLKSSGQDGRGFTAKVADFGMSSQINQTEGHVSSMFQGTLTHMAPEVLMQGHISKAGDVYAFGILMWELFAAADPYTDLPAALLGHAITQENRRPKFPPFAPRDYVLLAESCWAPDAADRPTFEEVHEELQAMLNNVPPTSVPLIIEPPKKSKSVSLTIGDDAGAVGDVRPDHASSEEFKKSHRKVCSPAEQMLNMLDQIIKGEKVTKDAAILLRRSIVLAGKDLHRPLERSFQPWSQVEKSGGKYLKGAASVVKSNGSTFKSISHNKSFILVIKEEDEEDLKEEDEEEGVCSQHGVCSDNKHANGSPMNQQRSSEGDWSRQSSAEMSSHKLNYHRLVEPGDEVRALKDAPL